jgi:hypothetical protein
VGTVLLVALVVIVVVAVIVVVRRQKKAQESIKRERFQKREDPFKREAHPSGDPEAIRVGDMVEIAGQTYAVRGTVKCTEGPYVWKEHFLDDATTKRWLSVENDEGDVEVILWTELPASNLPRGERTITFDGVQYRLDEEGTAMYVAEEGTTGTEPSGTVEYIDYVAPGGRYVSFERFSGPESKWEASTGTKIEHGLLTHYPVTPDNS